MEHLECSHCLAPNAVQRYISPNIIQQSRKLAGRFGKTTLLVLKVPINFHHHGREDKLLGFVVGFVRHYETPKWQVSVGLSFKTSQKEGYPHQFHLNGLDRV